jgi:abelson tyrosine-protein kinase 1
VVAQVIHTYVVSLVTIPLWDPSPVEVGAVGYLSKPQGHFVTLFNAFTPSKADNLGIQSLPSIRAYGPVQLATYKEDRRTIIQKSMDTLAGLLTSRTFSYVMTAKFGLLANLSHKVKKCLDVIHIL